MCCDPKHTKAEHDLFYSGQCPECGADVDDEGNSIDLNDCFYSPVECEVCGYCPCDESC